MNQSNAADIAGVMVAVRGSGLLVSLCTITTQPPSTEFGASGAPDPAIPYINFPGHVDIPCTAPPIQTGDNINATEMKSMQEIEAKGMLHVLLDNYYPTILNSYRAKIRAKGTAAATAIEYEIMNVESDSQRQMTRLALELVTN